MAELSDADIGDVGPVLPEYWSSSDREAWGERAAILQFDAGLSREVAEDRALRIVEARVRERMRDA